MPRVVAGLVSLLIATAAFAGGIAVYPHALTLRVGQSAVLHAENDPGGLSSGLPYSVKFTSDKRSVAEVTGFASGTGYLQPDPIPLNGNVYVRAIAPGIAHVTSADCCGQLATITVLPQPVLRIEPAALTVVQGQPAVFVAFISDAPPNVVYCWYAGFSAQTMQLVQQSIDPTLRFTPDPRLTVVSLRAVAPGWTGLAEARITVVPGRRRPTRGTQSSRAPRIR